MALRRQEKLHNLARDNLLKIQATLLGFFILIIFVIYLTIFLWFVIL